MSPPMTMRDQALLGAAQPSAVSKVVIWNLLEHRQPLGTDFTTFTFERKQLIFLNIVKCIAT